MIQIKPFIKHQAICCHCGATINSNDIIWQGMQILYKFSCVACDSEILEDLKFGHAINYPCQVNLTQNKYWCNSSSNNHIAKTWLGEPLLKSLKSPIEDLKIAVEIFNRCKNTIILNCIDSYYGHCILKLLNAQRHLENKSDKGLIVIVPKFLRWMVPEGVAEVWTVDISLRNGQCYYPKLNDFIQKESTRFEEIHISEAYSHPSRFDITKFTKILKHSFTKESYKVTFIWREDRLWSNFLLFRILKKLKLTWLLVWIQNWRVRTLFQQMRFKLPLASFAVVGLGKKTKFPQWIEDLRVETFDEATERAVCQIYSESRLVIGIHGSNMLLPSGHAGMTLDLMPLERWGNFAQDILYQENDSRLAAFKYRYLPLQTCIPDLAHIASSMILKSSGFNLSMTVDKTL
ncbi:MAG: hypothetical protein CLLPBCKN_005637 [Chroococcidiopsis cubana SAG 39.79]|uniref:Uncharacterized protein n=1 Tax=Chroococcidiopsis cubana SAG 39.79 TaxID=388085 RepID=A0AB37UPS3_9CYAN|nr:hypothetical protein [Chroococcidiopsis cubana]MDZ4876217.1 hypothetical protein [Chroococcidiopsis cubana SAG 39.79]PSB62155.1 hypothetical protein C7B79_19220 [Chroococcidiopsis cubana CCALA 043]RUT13427.1 hypothetical protein DSM107010_13820 [Chroococcidiopsis cubana SAG 39.79]